MAVLLINDYWEGGGAESVFRYQSEILAESAVFYAFKNISDWKISPLEYIYSFRFRKKLEDFLKNRHFDAIIVHNYCGALSPSILGVLKKYKQCEKCKIIYYAHDFHLVCPNRGYSYFKNGETVNFTNPPALSEILSKRLDFRGISHSLLKKIQWIKAYKLCKAQEVFDLVLSPSEFLAAQIRSLYPNMDVQRIYNPCSLPALSEKKSKTGDTMRMVYFGRLSQEKGLVNFINALKNSNINFTFTIIGEGEDKEKIENAIKCNSLDKKVFIRPRLPQNKLYQALAEFDIFVLPSLWYENAPLSIVEAAGAGLGLFLSGHGGVLEIGKICNAGHFFNPFDLNNIAAKLDVLYSDFRSNKLVPADYKLITELFGKEQYLKTLKHYIEYES
ncbi:MAG: glycosyltransferase [Dysgonamonadaceae bacterium]|jgi:glycosyltransferase involved in cell wall biosynthesis|nr:glycosyltransferase [Dysgonamonadaceae bacterium]